MFAASQTWSLGYVALADDSFLIVGLCTGFSFPKYESLQLVTRAGDLL